ncbi:MAG TPA: DNA methyltransferase, partial [Methylomirabilota bacterium]|nr:DNA methyltransferase [Methylomirabilota bacterium]
QGRWRSRIVGYGEADPRSLAANPANWRTHPEHQRAALNGVLDQVGWVAEVLVNQRSGFVVDGHLRVAAAIARHEQSVPVRYVDLEPDEERLVLATLDPISALANSDADQLVALLEDLHPADDAVAQLLRELAPPRAKSLNPDDADLTPPDEPVTRPGDLWLLGEHRLLCGDATSETDVRRLLAEDRASLVMTDPPYGVDYSAIVDSRVNQKEGGWRPLAGDLVQELAELLCSAFRLTAELATEADAAWFCWHPAGANARLFRDAFEAAGVGIHKQIIWSKPHFVFGRWEYHWQHEPAMYGWREHPPFYGDRSESTVWQVEHEGGIKTRNGPAMALLGLGEHPTQKPPELWARAIRNHTRAGQAVYDPFAGSGPCVTAAEELDRRARVMDIEPAYCDVIIRRWERVSGRTAIKADA